MKNRMMGPLVVLLALATAALTTYSGAARAEAREVRIAKADGISYLPFMMIERFRLIEEEAEKAGLGTVKVTWSRFANAAGMNDAFLSGNVDFAGIGTPGFLIMWDRTRTNIKVRGVAAMNSIPMVLNTREPRIKSIRDITERDRIALAGVKVSVTAIVLQMAAEKAFGEGKAFALDPQTVSMAHPDGMIALLGGKSEVTLHFTSPPFSTMEAKAPGIRSILSSTDVLGGPATYVMVQTAEKFHRENPRLYKAFLAALTRAIGMIKEDPGRAADTYLMIANSKEPKEDILAILSDPSIQFTTTPNGVMKYAQFLHRINTNRNLPGDWKELFFPEIHDQPGS